MSVVVMFIGHCSASQRLCPLRLAAANQHGSDENLERLFRFVFVVQLTCTIRTIRTAVEQQRRVADNASTNTNMQVGRVARPARTSTHQKRTRITDDKTHVPTLKIHSRNTFSPRPQSVHASG
eukprot:5865710-Prymnesium_polylepis.1